MEDLARALPGLSLSERQASSQAQTATSVDDGLHIADVTKPPTPPAAEGSATQPQHQNQHHVQPAPVPEYLDGAIRQALADPTQRLTVLKCEDLVEKFLADPVQEALQFPASFTSYQRMLAHRVGQYYGLQTSTVDYEESQGRVLAIRTMHCRVPKPRLRDMDVRSDTVAQRTNSSNGMDGPVADKPRLLRRQDDDRSQQNSSEHSLNQSPARTMKERQEIYMKAREELGLGSGPQDSVGAGRGGRGGPGGRFAAGGRMDGGRGRKAVFRDKDKDLSDPDYRRGMNRFNGTARFDPSYAPMPVGGIYQVPTYASEFPALNRMPNGGPPSAGRSQLPPQQQSHQLAPQPHMAAHPQHHGQAVPVAWGQQSQQQGSGGVRPPPPPPPPHQHVAGPVGGAVSNSGPNGKPHHQASGGGGASGSGVGGRQSQQQQQQQQQAFGPAIAASPYPGVGAQYPVPVAVGAAGFMPAGPGQPMFSMAAAGGAIPGAVYTAPAAGMGGAFYPSVGMGVGAMGMAVPTAPAYSYLAPAPGVGVGVGASGEAIALAPGGAYPVYASYAAGTTVYPAAAAQMQQAAAMHPAAGAAIPMRPMYGVPAFYQGYEPSQFVAVPGIQSHGQGDGRMYGGGYGNHQQQHHHGGPYNHGSGGMGSYGHGGHGGGRGRDSENGVGRGGSQAAAAASSGPNATGSGAGAGADNK